MFIMYTYMYNFHIDVLLVNLQCNNNCLKFPWVLKMEWRKIKGMNYITLSFACMRKVMLLPKPVGSKATVLVSCLFSICIIFYSILLHIVVPAGMSICITLMELYKLLKVVISSWVFNSCSGCWSCTCSGCCSIFCILAFDLTLESSVCDDFSFFARSSAESHL